MVSALDSESRGPGWRPGRGAGMALCSWVRHFPLMVPLFTQVYKWIPANLMLGVTLRWTAINPGGEGEGVEILIVALCTETGISFGLMQTFSRLISLGPVLLLFQREPEGIDMHIIVVPQQNLIMLSCFVFQ